MTVTDVLRRFNRTYTQRIGALDESFLGLGLPLGAARLVFEIGEAGATVRDLRARLGLDSGQLARQLRRLEDDGLVGVATDPADRRRRIAQLTGAGHALRARLDDRSEQLAEQLVAPLTGRQQERLTEALATADLLVRAATVDIRSVHPGSLEAQQAVHSYFDELDSRFATGFGPGDHRDEEHMAPGAGAFVVATSDGEPVACGGVQELQPGIGEIKRMWVHPGWRGAGLGSRLLRHLEQVAVDLGHTAVRLDTNGTLQEAIAMYERAGYRRIGRYNDNPDAQAWFEKALVTRPPA
jgi:DNA-binding MarR family transcriptional regulator/ribosomal protein S18 acetylase RimI-like enzyme